MPSYGRQLLTPAERLKAHEPLLREVALRLQEVRAGLGVGWLGVRICVSINTSIKTIDTPHTTNNNQSINQSIKQ